jgi:hypothetical protein
MKINDSAAAEFHRQYDEQVCRSLGKTASPIDSEGIINIGDTVGSNLSVLGRQIKSSRSRQHSPGSGSDGATKSSSGTPRPSLKKTTRSNENEYLPLPRSGNAVDSSTIPTTTTVASSLTSVMHNESDGKVTLIPSPRKLQENSSYKAISTLSHISRLIHQSKTLIIASNSANDSSGGSNSSLSQSMATRATEENSLQKRSLPVINNNAGSEQSLKQRSAKPVDIRRARSPQGETLAENAADSAATTKHVRLVADSPRQKLTTAFAPAETAKNNSLSVTTSPGRRSSLSSSSRTIGIASLPMRQSSAIFNRIGEDKSEKGERSQYFVPWNPKKNVIVNNSQMRRWHHVFPQLYQSLRQRRRRLWQSSGGLNLVKWKSLCTPACLPLTTDYFPSLEELSNVFQEVHTYILL